MSEWFIVFTYSIIFIAGLFVGSGIVAVVWAVKYIKDFNKKLDNLEVSLNFDESES